MRYSAIYKRNGSPIWQMQYWDGTYVARPHSPKPVRHMVQESTGETNQRRAEDKLTERLKQVEAGTYGGRKVEETTVAEL